MEQQERDVINRLFAKLADVERQGPARDPQAEQFIRNHLDAQPGSSYYMAQTIVVQEQALEAAQARIDELERQASRPSGGLLGSLFGGGARPALPNRGPAGPMGMGQIAAGPQRAAGPWGQQQQPARGGFLAGAAQTAMGVAGGMLLGNMIAGAFSGNEAQAAEPDAGDDAGMDDESF